MFEDWCFFMKEIVVVGVFCLNVLIVLFEVVNNMGNIVDVGLCKVVMKVIIFKVFGLE